MNWYRRRPGTRRGIDSFGFERRVNQEAEGAAGLEHGAMARVLWEQGPLAFAAAAQADARTPRVGEEPYFHAGMLAETGRLELDRRRSRGASRRWPARWGSLS